jgi:hypothetical protein
MWERRRYKKAAQEEGYCQAITSGGEGLFHCCSFCNCSFCSYYDDYYFCTDYFYNYSFSCNNSGCSYRLCQEGTRFNNTNNCDYHQELAEESDVNY